MEYICNNDLYKVTLDSYLTDFDRKILCELYQPIVGYSALSLFFTLWSKHERKLAINFVNHSSLFSQMGISQKEFATAKVKLEALGLLRTFVEEEDFNGNKHFIYVLYAPKAPKDFFDDVLFTGLLIKSIGEEEAMTIALSFTSKHEKNPSFKEATASFVDVFKPNFDDSCYDNRINDLKGFGRKVRKVETQFDFESFFTQIESDFNLTSSLFTPKEQDNIARVATLYGIDELNMSTLVNDSFDGSKVKGKRLNIKSLEELCKKEVSFIKKEDESNKASKSTTSKNIVPEISLMIELSAAEYLIYMQKGAKPSAADLSIVSTLSSDYHLATECINCIVYFTLQRCNNKLPKVYMEKVAATLVRSDINNAIDAYQYLYSSKNEEVEENQPKDLKKTSNNAKVKEVKDDESEIDEDFAARFKGIVWR